MNIRIFAEKILVLRAILILCPTDGTRTWRSKISAKTEISGEKVTQCLIELRDEDKAIYYEKRKRGQNEPVWPIDRKRCEELVIKWMDWKQSPIPKTEEPELNSALSRMTEKDLREIIQGKFQLALNPPHRFEPQVQEK